jgi:hypothetical protein
MTRRVLLVMVSVTALATSLLWAQTYTFQKLDPKQSLMNTVLVNQIPGCDCHMGDNAAGDARLKQLYVNPTAIGTIVGRPVEVRYDGSALCGGQSVRDVNGNLAGTSKFDGVGTIEWQPGSIQKLPDLYGMVTFSGYNQPRKGDVTINIKVQCYDTGAKCTMPNDYKSCSLSAKLPLFVK